MREQRRLAVAVAVLVCALTLGARASGRELEQACRTQRIDKAFYLVVDQRVCNFYRPGNASERGPAAFTSSTRTPADCITVNETIPGPPIRVTLGDWVRVDVQNNLIGREISVHWHGFSQKGTPWSDGAGMFTSCNIRPGQGQTYVFQALEAGTFFYHGHGGLEEEYGLAGALIVDDPADPFTDLFDEETPHDQELRDWWWAPDGHAAQALAFRYYQVMAPRGIPLINGLYGNGSSILPLPIFDLATNTCYKTRFINGNTEWPGWSVSITNEVGQPVNMTMLALTGEDLRPFNTHKFHFYIAQRVDAVFCTGGPGIWNVLVNSSQPEDGYCTGPTPGCINGLTYQFRVGGINSTRPKTANRARLQSLPFVANFDSMIHPEQVIPLVPVVVPARPTQTWEVYTAIGGLVPGFMYGWTERGWAFAQPTAPPLFTRGGRCGTAPEPLPGQVPNATNNRAYLKKTVRHDEVVDIIFNNLSPFMHPMHLHGHDVTVLGSRYYVDAGYSPQPQNVCPTDYLWAVPGWDGVAGPPWPARAPTGGNFAPFAFGCPRNASQDNSQYYLQTPYETDIVPVPPHGWTHVRVKFDNPGFWYLHCHLQIHMVNGMGFMVHAGTDRVPRIPSWVDTSCGGRCQALDQVCGTFARERADVPRCSHATDTCPPTGPINSAVYG